MRLAKRLHVEGRVQGVGYRVQVRGIAESLGVRGWVRNLPDGSVEVVAEGTAEQLERFVTRIETDVRLARVRRIHTTAIEPVGFTSFDITG